MPGIWETNMNFSQRSRSLFKTIAVVLALALPTALAISSADARVGGGLSSGSRGSRTFSAPPSTTTAPGSTSQFNRTYSQPNSAARSEEHTSELQSQSNLVCRLLLEKKNRPEGELGDSV